MTPYYALNRDEVRAKQAAYRKKLRKNSYHFSCWISKDMLAEIEELQGRMPEKESLASCVRLLIAEGLEAIKGETK